MCGIVGVIGDIKQKDRDIFKLMLQFDVIRGKHSVGIVGFDKVGDTFVNKKAMLPQDFLELKATKDIIAKTNLTALIGHNRYATVGAVSNNTAHPFEFDDVVGVHNGTLKVRYDLDDREKFAVDSEQLYNHMDNHGFEETMKVVGQHASNAWTLAFINKPHNTFHLTRNEQRPMWVACSKSGKTMYYASEPWMIQVACQKNSVEIGDVLELEPKKLLTINLAEPEIVEAMTLEDVVYEVKKYNTTKVSYLGGNKKTSTAGTTTTGTNTSSAPTASTMSAKERVEQARKTRDKWVGKTVVFEVVEEPKDKNGFFKVIAKDPVDGTWSDVDIRIFLNANEAKRDKDKERIFNQLKHSVTYFSGTIKQLKYNGGRPYLSVTWGTVKETNVNLLTYNPPVPKNATAKAEGHCMWCQDGLVDGNVYQSKGGAKFCATCINDSKTFSEICHMGYRFA